MKMREGLKSFLRDVAVNLAGVLIAAGISIYIGFWVYDYRSQNQCNNILEMVIQEQRINEENSRIILNFLAPILVHKKPDKLSLNMFHNRLQVKSINIASESVFVMRFTTSRLRSDIVAHWDNLTSLNNMIDRFNHYIAISKPSSKISYSFVKQYAEIIIETINKRSADSKILSAEIRTYLDEQ
jgi:hypothetical protein